MKIFGTQKNYLQTTSLRYLRSFLKVQLECLKVRETVRQRVYAIYVRFSGHVPEFKILRRLKPRVYAIYVRFSGHIPEFKILRTFNPRVYAIYVRFSGHTPEFKNFGTQKNYLQTTSLRYLRSFWKVQLECLRVRGKVRQQVSIIYVRFSGHIPEFKILRRLKPRVYAIYVHFRRS